jgi:hypothetical protein
LYRHIIHLHIPAFSIAVARVCEPRLRDRPVAVAPPQSERALVISASSEARKEGVFKGIPIGKAIKLCPDLTVLPPNPEQTEKACNAQGISTLISQGQSVFGGGLKIRDVISGGRLRVICICRGQWVWQATKWSPALPLESGRPKAC